MRIGTKETSWEDLFNLSASGDPGNRPALILEDIHERIQYPLKGRIAVHNENDHALATLVNNALEKSLDKDITIYVHGANTAIYRASVQAAQYHHFTGRNSIVMVFLWPSAENLFAYGTDTRHARKSAPAFARLLTLLSEHTQAKNINILAYSAGALIVSPALDILGRTTKRPKRKDLRIGQVYYAAADIGVDTFVTHLKNYIDIPRNITLAINLNDSVLSLSARRNKVSRAGSPDVGDLSPLQKKWVKDAANNSKLTLIGINPERVLYGV